MSYKRFDGDSAFDVKIERIINLNYQRRLAEEIEKARARREAAEEKKAQRHRGTEAQRFEARKDLQRDG